MKGFRPVLLTILLGLIVSLGTVHPGATAAQTDSTSPLATGTADDTRAPSDPTSARDDRASLQPGWRTSSDQLWTLRGDATGLHLLAASADSAYSWRTVASLGDPAVDTDRWIGNACLTRSGDYAIVVYAPRAYTNRPGAFLRGGLSAIVDMATGAVRPLEVGGSLAYYNPGCGSAEDAVLTQSRFPEESGKPMATRLYRVHAPSGRVDPVIEKTGQYSSAVPTVDGIVATRGDSLVSVGTAGAVRTLVRDTGGAFGLTVDRDGGIVFIKGTREHNAAVRLPASGPSSVLTEAAGHWLGVTSGVGGRVFVHDPEGVSRTIGHGVSVVRSAVQDEISTHGEALLFAERMPAPRSAESAWRNAQTLAITPEGGIEVNLAAKVRSTGKTVEFSITPGIRSAPRATSGLTASSVAPKVREARTSASGPSARTSDTSSAAATTPVTGTADTNPACSVPRNDPKTQVYQPTARQVEWAADQAVVNNLQTARPYNWKQSGLASWTPQKMFPSKSLVGGGRVPAQILLGILAQESNLWQASGHALSGVFGNPLVGDYYGRDGGWSISYGNADCGYGVGQVTDGMRKPAYTTADMVPALPAQQQRAIAMDYETNIARALQILQDKWNQTKAAGLVHDDGNPASLENWIFAIWAYNTGFYPNKGDGSGWGVGWFNNPANPIYPANRGFFNENPGDAAHPSDWPYQEKVIGWAAYSISTPDGPGFRPAWWISEEERGQAVPFRGTFCDASNNCTLEDGCPALNSSCWWHKPVLYHDCQHGFCGNELLRFNTTYPEQPDGTNYPPVCTTAGLPTGSLVIDDVPATVKSPRAGCGHPWTEKGKFTMAFATPSARIDFHQIAAGFGGHFWFAHTRKGGDTSFQEATGTWKYTTYLNKWGRVFVHVPDHGAHTQQAAYRINLGNGTVKTRYLPQRKKANQWVSLGVMKFAGYPSITLSSQTFDGQAIDDIAWDAVAIQPLAAKPRNFVVAMGDSYSSGEGANDPDGGDDYYPESDHGGSLDNDKGRNACHRSPFAWSRRAALADSSSTIGARADSYDATMDYHLIACSGAESENLLPYHSVPAGSPLPTNAWDETGKGQYGEVSQLDQGYLDENTTLVMLSIGGNDAQFGPVISVCAGPSVWGDCLDEDTTGYGPNSEAIPALIRSRVADSIMRDIRQIHAAAPNARILLMGYPELISDGGGCVGAGEISPTEAAWIDAMSQVMDTALSDIADAMTGEGITIADGVPIDDFLGKGVCGDPEQIHGVVLNKTSGDEPDLTKPSQQSYHPKIGGTALYAAAANRALRELGQ